VLMAGMPASTRLPHLGVQCTATVVHLRETIAISAFRWWRGSTLVNRERRSEHSLIDRVTRRWFLFLTGWITSWDLPFDLSNADHDVNGWHHGWHLAPT